MLSTIGSRGRPNSRASMVKARTRRVPSEPASTPRVSGGRAAIVGPCNERLRIEDQDGTGVPQIGGARDPRVIAQPASDRLHDDLLTADEVVDDDSRPAPPASGDDGVPAFAA